MEDLQSIRQASIATGISRNTIADWIRRGILKGKRVRTGHLYATMVSVEQIKSLREVERRGRPAKS